jgi:hypothetical protein
LYYSWFETDGGSGLVRKHPVSIALSNRVLEKIDKEASKQKRSRSEYVELHFETLFFNKDELEKGLLQE